MKSPLTHVCPVCGKERPLGQPHAHCAPPPPGPRKHRDRLPEKAKLMQPGDAWNAPLAVIACIRAYGRAHGWKMVQKREGKTTWLWRLA